MKAMNDETEERVRGLVTAIEDILEYLIAPTRSSETPSDDTQT